MTQHNIQLVNRGDNIMEAKVKTGAAASSLGGLIIALLGTYAFTDGVPGPVAQTVSLIVGAVVPPVLTAGAGWLTKHTPLSIGVVDT